MESNSNLTVGRNKNSPAKIGIGSTVSWKDPGLVSNKWIYCFRFDCDDVMDVWEGDT